MAASPISLPLRVQVEDCSAMYHSGPGSLLPFGLALAVWFLRLVVGTQLSLRLRGLEGQFELHMWRGDTLGEGQATELLQGVIVGGGAGKSALVGPALGGQ